MFFVDNFFGTCFWILGRMWVLCNTVITCCVEKAPNGLMGFIYWSHSKSGLDLRVRNPIYHDLNCRWVTVSQTIVVFFWLIKSDPKKWGLKKFGFRSKMFHYPHKRPAPSEKLDSPWLMQRLGVHQRFPLGAVFAALWKVPWCHHQSVYLMFKVFWMSEHAGKFLLWQIQSRSKSYSCPPRQKLYFTCILKIAKSDWI